MNIKSERLKKLEIELADLEKWLDLGLVPKKDIEKHKVEITSIKQKIEEEKERLRFMKETGDMQDYVAPKKSPAKQIYPEPQTMPDMDIGADQVKFLAVYTAGATVQYVLLDGEDAPAQGVRHEEVGQLGFVGGHHREDREPMVPLRSVDEG